MSGFRFEAHIGVTILPSSHAITDPVCVRHAVPVEVRRATGAELPVVATIQARHGRGTIPVRLRGGSDGLYVEVLGPRLERLGESEFSRLVARCGAMGPQGQIAWDLNPFGTPPPHGPDTIPALAEDGVPNGREDAASEARRIGSTLISVDGEVFARRTAPGWRVEDRDGLYVVHAHTPSSRREPPPPVSERRLTTYWVDVPGNRRDVLDAILVGGRLAVAGNLVDRASDVPLDGVSAGCAGFPSDTAIASDEAIDRLVAASSGLEPSSSASATAWMALRAQRACPPDLGLRLRLLETMAERERADSNPTLGTAAWMELAKLSAMEVKA
jgi:hypothetical protein